MMLSWILLHSLRRIKAFPNFCISILFIFSLQIRGCQILDALRMHKQGFPEHIQYGEFRRRFSVLAPSEARVKPPVRDEKSAVDLILPHLELDGSTYRLGLSQVCLS